MRTFIAAAIASLALAGPAAAETYWLMDFERGCRQVEIEAAMAQASAIVGGAQPNVRVESFFDGDARVLRLVVMDAAWGVGSTSVYTSDRRHCFATISDYRFDDNELRHGRPLTIGYGSPEGVLDMTTLMLGPPRNTPIQPTTTRTSEPRGTVVLKPRYTGPSGN